MKQTIILIFVFLTTYCLTSSAQQPTPWANPYFYYHYNAPLPLSGQIVSANEMLSDQKQFSSYDDQSVQNTLESHVVLLTTCLRELKTTKADLVQTHSDVESVKNKLNDLVASFAGLNSTVDNIKKDMNASAAPTSIGRIPQTCDDLQKIGHRKSGLFPVMGNKTVDNVYCDFTKPTTDAGFQKTIGYFDVKTSPVFFYAQKNSSFATVNAAIPFELLTLNVGNAMSNSGIFVAPKPGKYFFSYSGISLTSALGRVDLQLKTATADWVRIGESFGSLGVQTFSQQATLKLAGGDQIRLLLAEGGVFEDGRNYTHFVGHLLEEDIQQA